MSVSSIANTMDSKNVRADLAPSRRQFVAGSAAAGLVAAGLGSTVALADESAGEQDAAEDASAADAADAVEYTEGTPAWKITGGVDWLGPEPQISDNDVTSEEDCDVVVVGLGNSGVIAYRSAAEAGARVIAVEKSETANATGGQFALIGGSVEERWGRADIDKEEIINRHMEESGWFCKRPIMSRYAYEVGDMFDWLLEPLTDLYIADEQMADIPDDTPNYLTPDMYPLPEGYDYHDEMCPTFPTSVSFGNLAACNAEQVTAAEATGNASAHYGCFAEKLVMEDGRVAGVYVRDAVNGGYIKINAAKGVILATGDYSSDESMVRAFLPETIENGVQPMWIHTDVEGNMTNTGDGHRMGTWVGAAIQQHHAPNDHSMGGGAGIAGDGVMGICPFLNLNLEGKRFMNEDMPGGQIQAQLEQQPGHKTYQFFDSAWPEEVGSFPLIHGMINYCLEEDEMPKNSSAASFCTRSRTSVETAVEEGRCLKADTIEELVAMIEDIDQETALESIERYNELAAAGEDEDFHKRADRMFALENPPYYACAFKPAIMLTAMGGLKSDENCHTYDVNGKIIPGLYVSGNVQGDRFAVAYPISLKGLSIGMAQFYGYVAGQNAAQGA